MSPALKCIIVVASPLNCVQWNRYASLCFWPALQFAITSGGASDLICLVDFLQPEGEISGAPVHLLTVVQKAHWDS